MARMGQPDFQGYAGPGDRDLPMSEIQGYQPPSRQGEIVMNAFVDSYEFASLQQQLTAEQMVGVRTAPDLAETRMVEHKPMFHEWATAQPGMIALSRKKKTAVFRQYVAAETAAPVIVCAACLPEVQSKDFFFAGIVRSKSVRSPDDGIGPQVDEFFTLSIGGLSQILNNSGMPIHPGDLIEWCLINKMAQVGDKRTAERAKTCPRRVAIRTASASSSRIIGRALSFAKNGEPLDILIKQ